MRFVVDQFEESLPTNATNPSAAARMPAHFLAKNLAKLIETARRELDSVREAAKPSLLIARKLNVARTLTAPGREH
jgi:hypothetical protein